MQHPAITNYNPSARTITFADVVDRTMLLKIVNGRTHENLYDVEDIRNTATLSEDGKTLTLTSSTVGELADDPLQVSWVNQTQDVNFSGEQIQVTVQGGLTDEQLRAAPLDVVGPLTNTELRAAALHAIVDNASINVAGPVTDAQLRATPLPVSGPLTDTQLRATAVPVSGPLTDTQLRLNGTLSLVVRGLGGDTNTYVAANWREVR